MQENYGLFIPDVEYLVDPEGLIAYLAHKVINGKTCLWTGRQFRTSQSCIQSMIDSSNCRIKYETEDDFAEYADFYDFTTSYPEGEEDARVDGEAEGAAAAAVGRVDEGDGWVSDEDDAEGEQIPTGELRSGGWTKVKVDDAAEDGNAGAHKKRTITVNEQGELLLLDGRIVGHRKFKRFYKQRYSDLDTSVQMVTINGVSQPLPSKIRAVVRRFPQHKQSQLLLGYQEGGYDALAMVKKPREAGGLVSVRLPLLTYPIPFLPPVLSFLPSPPPLPPPHY
jgi:pre-60S factor REI1